MLNNLEAQPQPDDARGWIDWTTGQQTKASDPDASAWVSANAGSGKTHVLTQRVIRLLLAGCRPSAILCLTYTKAAASEMSSRVFNRLAEWATLSDDDLRKRIAAVEGKTPDLFKLQEARRLFAKALETPGGLKIQTIHAFCEALLHQFPLEANVAGHFSVLDDRAASVLLAEARRSLLTAVSSEEDPALTEAFAFVLDVADDTGLETLLQAIVSNRRALMKFLGEIEEHEQEPKAYLKELAGIDASVSAASLKDAAWPLRGLNGLALDTYLTLADEVGGKRVKDVSYTLRQARAESDPETRLQLIKSALLKADGREAKSDAYVIDKAVTKAASELLDALIEARTHLVQTIDAIATLEMIDATSAALTLAQRLVTDFEELKKQRSQLDFDDLIERTAVLLNQDTAGAWVHYKLDQGIDHILVDEAQDTSPLQWSIIQSLASDFFTGQTAKTGKRTIFAVGDEKQSIYSFQGARPERFSQEREETKKRVLSVEQDFYPIRLPLSFRSTDDVLAAVDQVFADSDNAQGLSADNEPVQHRSNRIGHPGTVELWDLIAATKAEDDDDWMAPFDALRESAPPAVLAKRIAARISDMIGKEVLIEKEGARTIEAGDILVLVRKRGAFVNALTRELKKRKDIPVAGADRLRLTDHIAVQDLLALGKFVVLPEDDLSLAAILKSPLFNLSEEQLMELAAYRPEQTGLWAHMKALCEDATSHFFDAYQTLTAFIDQARRSSVHDFYAAILTIHHGRQKFLARLGSEASDVLDEFLSFSLDHERAGLPGLQSFIAVLESDSPEVKREQDKARGEVRIMTVHASKGLEAPVVFLVDGSSKAFNHSHLPKLRMIESTSGAFPIWMPSSGYNNAIVDEDVTRLKQSADEEYRRLLYVAMTRAADQLIICAYSGLKENDQSWHSMISKAFAQDEARCKETEFTACGESWGGKIWHSTSRVEQPDIIAPPMKAEQMAVELPAALFAPLPPSPFMPRPLSPSGAGIVIDSDEEITPQSSPLFGEDGKFSSLALQRGRLVHRMLQMLPEIKAELREEAAKRYAARAAKYWPSQERERLVTSTLNVLASEAISSAFTANSRAEVSVMGSLKLGRQQFAVSGRIDRLAVNGDEVVLVDYKTNRQPPMSSARVDQTYILQMAIYREILKPLYPGKTFTCAFVFTENASAIVIEPKRLDDALAAFATK
jgi:ATP-dependent helicase/nuclease subunit A